MSPTLTSLIPSQYSLYEVEQLTTLVTAVTPSCPTNRDSLCNAVEATMICSMLQLAYRTADQRNIYHDQCANVLL